MLVVGGLKGCDIRCGGFDTVEGGRKRRLLANGG